MYAKAPFRKREDASAPQLRRTPPLNSALEIHADRRASAAPTAAVGEDLADDGLEPGVKSAFERALRTPPRLRPRRRVDSL